jgi:hypothetical protein
MEVGLPVMPGGGLLLVLKALLFWIKEHHQVRQWLGPEKRSTLLF